MNGGELGKGSVRYTMNTLLITRSFVYCHIPSVFNKARQPKVLITLSSCYQPQRIESGVVTIHEAKYILYQFALNEAADT
jgi:hypothetical protein